MFRNIIASKSSGSRVVVAAIVVVAVIVVEVVVVSRKIVAGPESRVLESSERTRESRACSRVGSMLELRTCSRSRRVS